MFSPFIHSRMFEFTYEHLNMNLTSENPLYFKFINFPDLFKAEKRLK